MTHLLTRAGLEDSRAQPLAPVIGPHGVGWMRAGPRRSINIVLLLIELGQAKGMSAAEVLEGTGLRPADLTDPAKTMSFDQEFTLIRNLQAHCGDAPGLGLDAGELYRFTSLTWFGFAMLSSATLRQAFDLSVRYANLGMSLVRVAHDGNAQDLRIAFADDELPADVRRFAVERTLAVGLTAYGRLLGRQVIPLSLELAFPAPGPGIEFYARRLGVTPTFNAARSRVILSARDADEPLANGNALAFSLAEHHGRELAAAAEADRSMAARVRRCIALNPVTNSEMRKVAAEFCMSERTLRRHLQLEGTSFACLCEQVRESLAEQLLTMQRLPVEQVALRLGYAETSSFIHAFKRWKGTTPHVFRSGELRGSVRLAERLTTPRSAAARR